MQSRSEEYHAEEAARHLAELRPGRQPYSLFREAARIFALSAVELIALREGEKGLEVLLTQRPEDDEFWPLEWHVPGSVILADDVISGPNDYRAPLDRLINGELEGSLEVVRGPHLLYPYRHTSPRGSGITIVHWAEVSGEPSVGKFFETGSLSKSPPKGGIVDGHSLIINDAVKAYGAAIEST